LARLIKKLNVWAGREIFYFYFLRGVLGGKTMKMVKTVKMENGK